VVLDPELEELIDPMLLEGDIPPPKPTPTLPADWTPGCIAETRLEIGLAAILKNGVVLAAGKAQN
jgi:hypothetical protein